MSKTILPVEFFRRDASEVAKDLLGKVIFVRYEDFWLSTQIVETEAYYIHDKGSHSSLGFTQKRKALFMQGGTIYMYYARGGDSLNMSCEGEGNACLIKSGKPYVDESSDPNMIAIMQRLNPFPDGRFRMPEKLCSGQTLLCKSMGLKVPEWDQKQLDPERFYFADVAYRPRQIIQAKRLGIPIGRDEHLPYRFIDFDYASYCTDNPLKKRALLLNKDYWYL